MAEDRGSGGDALGVLLAGHAASESGRETTGLLVRKWDADQVAWVNHRLELGPCEPGPREFLQARVAPAEVFEYYGNLITNAGWGQLLLSVLTGSPTLFSATVGRIGVGTGTSAAAHSDTALQSTAGMTGTTNWVLCGVAPTVQSSSSPATAIFTASFPSGDANGAWNEFAVDQGTSTGGSLTTAAVAPMMNHSANIGAGTKASGQVWAATATLSFT